MNEKGKVVMSKHTRQFELNGRYFCFGLILALMFLAAISCEFLSTGINPYEPTLATVPSISIELGDTEAPPTSTSEPTVSPTITDTATPTPERQETEIIPVNISGEAVFSSSNSEKSPPNDVHEELYFGAGAGGYAGCFGINSGPMIVAGDISCSSDNELHRIIDLYSCGWQDQETVNITLTLPDGRIVTETAKFEYPSAVIFEYKPHILEDPPGNYDFVFEGQSGQVEYNIDVKQPIGPRFYWDDDGTLILYNFSPNEKVRIFAYLTEFNPEGLGIKLTFSNWQLFQVDLDGQLVIKTKMDDEIGWYVAIGEINGEVMPSYLSSRRLYGWDPFSIQLDPPTVPTPTKGWPVSDTGVEACYISVGDTVHTDSNARLWSLPDVRNADLVVNLERNIELVVIGGPDWGRIRTDTDHQGWWWQVKSPDGTRGWLWQDRILECLDQ
ncbi:hypothetical protein ACFLZW_03280 [Chloroflexota bacterium]